MATNCVFQEGRQLELTIAAATANAPVVVGTMTGVCVVSRDSTTGKAVIDFGGVYDLSVKGIDDAGNSAVALGDKIYYVVGDTPLLSKKASGYFFGYALEAVGSGSTDTIQVKNVDGGGAGTLDLAAEEIPLTLLADLARGSIISGQGATNRPTALVAKTSGQILVGDGTDVLSVAVSGDVTLAANGAVTIANDAVTTAKILDENVTLGKMADLTRGSIITGQTAGNRPTALDAKASGQILVGDGTDVASVAVSGDATLSSAGALTIGAGAIVASKAKVFFSTEVTGNGGAQNTAHGLGGTPAGVLVVPSVVAAALSLVQGAHDATNVIVTCNNNDKYYIFAWR